MTADNQHPDTRKWAYTAKCRHGVTVAFDAFDDDPFESQKLIADWVAHDLTVYVETGHVMAQICQACRRG